VRIGLLLVALSVAAAGCIKIDVPEAPVSQPLPEAAQASYTGPLVEFTWKPSAIRVGQEVSFSPTVRVLKDTHVTEWSWDFGDGGKSSKPTPEHRFASAGLMTVTLSVRASDGLPGKASHVVPVGQTSATSAGAGAGPPLSLADPVISVQDDGLAFRFSFEWSVEPDTLAWDFGDGSTSQERAPTHAYAEPGTYTVALHVLHGNDVRSAEVQVLATTSLPHFRLSPVGASGAEPSVGITSSGCIFFAAFEDVRRSCDAGASWSSVAGPLSSPVSFDPYLWVDPVTDRVFDVQMIYLACTWISFTDDDGASWVGNPMDCGTIPVNDHIKLGSGPWVGTEHPLNENPVYPRAVYFCMNKLVTVECCTSVDGGLTFTICRPAGSGGLHGAISTAPDGTVFVPPRSETPSIHISRDNGVTWSTVTMPGADTPEPRKNSEVAADVESNAYHTWVGADMGVRLASSTDVGRTWSASLRASPPEVISATFPQIDAGDPGRIAIAYLGSEDAHLLGTPDIDGDPWDGNPHTAPEGVRYHLYVTFSLDALAPEPAFVTVKATKDPVQVGSICISSGDCRDIGGSNRNLLDFNDLHIDREGRVHVAFADGCTGACADDHDPKPGDSRDDAGTVAILWTGPSLYAAFGDLPAPA
jgi:PKD repeat protein